MEKELTRVQLGLNVNNSGCQADMKAVYSDSEVNNVSTGFLSRDQSLLSWERDDSSPGRMNSATSMVKSTTSNVAGFGEATADEPNVVASRECSVCEKTGENFDVKQTLDFSSGVGGTKTQINSSDTTSEMPDDTVVMWTGDRIHDHTEVEFNEELSRTIEIADVGEDLLDSTELYVEHGRHGGGEVEKFDYDRERRNLTVVFVDAEGNTLSVSIS